MELITSGLHLDAEDLVSGFFETSDSERSQKLTKYFERTWVEPPTFDNLKKELSPSPQGRFFVLRGQSRIGKTWCALRMAQVLLKDGIVRSVWSSGEDSWRVFNTLSEHPPTLAQGVRRVIDTLADLRRRDKLVEPVFILLDDFFGTTGVRPIGSPEDRRVVRELISRGGSENPLSRVLEGMNASIVLTSRSVLYLVARLLLNVEADGMGPQVINFHQGGRFEWTDPLSETFLHEVLVKNKLFRTEDSSVHVPVMTVFAPENKGELLDADHVASTLFEADLSELANQIDDAEEDARVIDLQKAYILALFPGLSFPGPAPEEWPHGHNQTRDLRVELCLQPEDTGDLAFRVPNRYYLHAIASHFSFSPRLTTASRTVRALTEWLHEDEAVLTRGLIEWSLELLSRASGPANSGGPMPSDPEYFSTRVAKEIRPPLDTLQFNPTHRHEQLFLSWEYAVLSRKPVDYSELANLSLQQPGLAVALGWAMYRFRHLPELAISSERGIPQQLVKCFSDAVSRQSRSLNGMSATVVKNAAVSYSNLFRWLAQIDPRPSKKSVLNNLLDIGHEGDDLGPMGEQLRMVREDALVWADTLHFKDGGDTAVRVEIENLRVTRALISSLEKLDRPESPAEIRLLVNRLFSLAWHNEWMERKSKLKPILSKWIERNREQGLFILKDRANLVSDNLEYHWHHMIAQWSVWTRDWCFSRNPIAYERDRAPLGCTENLGHNVLICDVLGTALDWGHENQTNLPVDTSFIRNAFFLFGMRSERRPAGECRSLEYYLGLNWNPASIDSLLQAVFELARQGYLDAPGAPGDRLAFSSDTQKPVMAFLARHWDRLADVHKSYSTELRGMTCLELLPKEPLHLFGKGLWQRIVDERGRQVAS